MEINLIEAKCLEFKSQKSMDSYEALQFVVNLLVGDIHPFMRNLANKLKEVKKEDVSEESFQKIRNVYVLCSDQIKKCFINFLDLIRIENRDGFCILESRNCLFERISWCYQRLLTTEEQLTKLRNNYELDRSNDSLLLDSMYFVNWVDQTFEILSKMTSVVYKSNFEEELVECVRGLHTSIDELLLSAMTLCRYCLPSDQVVVKARCQVVLRETKALLSDLIEGNLDGEYQATRENLKLPIMPFNVSVLIDVLKDVLYALETNTNTSLLALLVHSFSQNVSPAQMLRKHLIKSHLSCSCVSENAEDVEEKCEYVKSFDTYNERLLQIGTFAMSCSCDEKRILGLRSGLASLEALDPHLVPALMLSPTSQHSSLLLKIWTEEVMQIRNNVFLIVDPSAFAEKTKQIMQQKLLELMKKRSYDNARTCEVINIGYLVYEFFDVYNQNEPEALPQYDKLKCLLDDLYKAQIECKIVSNSLCSDGDFVYDIKKAKVTVSNEKLVKRLQLLYTIVKRIYLIFAPKENDDDFYNDEPAAVRNDTYTLNIKKQTYVQSPRKPVNVTKSIFARTINVRSTPRKLPLAILTRHLKTKTDLSFSIKLDDIDLSEVKKRETSILYHPNVKSRCLRKAVLSKHLAVKCEIDNETLDRSQRECKDSFMDDSMNLQITDVLNQLNDLTTSVAANMRRPFNSTAIIEREDRPSDRQENNKVDSLNITQPSEVNTLERIKDLELVESKLSDLRFGHIETSL